MCVPRGLDQIAGLVGIMQAGATHVPVDWYCPTDRIDLIVNDSNAKLII